MRFLCLAFLSALVVGCGPSSSKRKDADAYEAAIEADMERERLVIEGKRLEPSDFGKSRVTDVQPLGDGSGAAYAIADGKLWLIDPDGTAEWISGEKTPPPNQAKQ